MAILVTGGAGYIGSHTCIALIEAGFEVVVVDNLCNSKEVAIKRVEAITNTRIPFYCVDINHKDSLSDIFKQYTFEAVIHFAGLKAVGESCEQPLAYYQNNVSGTLTLCEVMKLHHVSRFIFSSSATVYGDPASVPITENFSTQAASPYGRSKLMVEEMLEDICAAPTNDWQVSLLRYFNPIGAHKSGTIGEDPSGIPCNLLPYIAQVAVGKLEKIMVFGGDYPTCDGTGVRDYIHVVDLANGHVKALVKLLKSTAGCYTYNLGTGKGSSVLEVIQAFEQACGKKIPYEIAQRRAGDIAEYYADPTLARNELEWKAEFDIKKMVEDTWRWQSNNPNGYEN